MNTYDMICHAIKHKKSIHAVSKGQPRYLCPHLVGMRFVKNEPETIQVLCYQYAGETSDGRPLAAPGSEKNLKCFMVDELSEVRFADDGIWETVTEVGKLYSMERWKVRFSDVYDCLENHVETDEDET